MSRTNRIVLSLLVFLCLPLRLYAEIQVITNASDKRVFDFVELDNKLKVLLISDPSAKKSAVALDVNIGSAEDPSQYLGMAHFLEHMLFLGTKKYPEAGEFQAFIASHGGRHNAYTSLLNTNYYFDIDAKHLEPAVDRFSRFFWQPLFQVQYVDRERQAVHSEYASKISLSSRRERDVLAELVRDDHPLSKFYTGNKDTLGEANPTVLRDALVAFYEQYYSANIMALVISGPQTLSALKKIAVQNFSPIKNSDVALQAHGSKLFPPNFLPAEVHIQPKKERRQLSLLFPVPSEKPFRDSKPLQYIANFLGHEGKGSLLSLLKSRKFATGLSAGSSFEWRGGESFSVKISLTELGVEKLDLVRQLVFEYLSMLREEGIAEWRFDELKRLAKMRFDYSEIGNAVGEASRIAAGLHDTRPEEIFWQGYKLDKFSPKTIAHFLAFLRPDNALTALVAPGLKTIKESKFYFAPYSVVKKGQSMRITQKMSEEVTGLRSRLRMPRKNPYTPQRFSVIDRQNAEGGLPQIIFSRSGSQGWFLNDDISSVPKGVVNLRIWLPKMSASVNHLAVAKIYVKIIDDALNEDVYEASLAGLSYTLSANARGFDVDFYGYSDGLPKLIDRVVGEIRRINRRPKYREKLIEAYYEQTRKDLARSYQNQQYRKLYTQALRELPPLLYSPHWSVSELHAAFESLDSDTFDSTIQQLFSDGYFEALVFGNFSKKTAKRIHKTFSRAIKRSSRENVAPAKVAKLFGSKRKYLKVLDTPSKENVLGLYVQGRNTSLAEQAGVMLIEHMMSSPFYRVLRTEKQLGYLVFSSNYRMREVPGILSLVQSPTHDSAKLYQHMQDFFREHKHEVFETFEQDKRALILKLEEPNKNQAEWSSFYWQSILEGDFRFDRKLRLIAKLKELDRVELQRSYEALFLDQGFHLAIAHDAERNVLANANEDDAAPLRPMLGVPQSTVVELEGYEQIKNALPAYDFD